MDVEYRGMPRSSIIQWKTVNDSNIKLLPSAFTWRRPCCSTSVSWIARRRVPSKLIFVRAFHQALQEICPGVVILICSRRCRFCSLVEPVVHWRPLATVREAIAGCCIGAVGAWGNGHERFVCSVHFHEPCVALIVFADIRVELESQSAVSGFHLNFRCVWADTENATEFQCRWLLIRCSRWSSCSSSLPRGRFFCRFAGLPATTTYTEARICRHFQIYSSFLLRRQLCRLHTTACSHFDTKNRSLITCSSPWC